MCTCTWIAWRIPLHLFITREQMNTGGDINGRLRLTLEVIAKIRELCGDDFIIDVRISGDEYSEVV